MAAATLASLGPSQADADMLQLVRALHSTLLGLEIICDSQSPFLRQTVVTCGQIVDRLGCEDSVGADAYSELAQAYYCMTQLKIGPGAAAKHGSTGLYVYDIGMTVDMYRYHCLQAPAESFNTDLSWLKGQHLFPKQHLHWQQVDQVLAGAASFASQPAAAARLITKNQMVSQLASGAQRELVLLHLKEHSAGIPDVSKA